LSGALLPQGGALAQVESSATRDASGAAAPHYYVPPMPTDLGEVDFYLMTIGLGDDLAGRFGHTGIRINDKLAGTDVVFNWGKFSFDQPNFAWKFFRGSLTYSMGVRTFQGDILHFSMEQRHIQEERLNLTLTQKRKLMERIAANAIPANRDFAYQYWFKNCSTIPRDYLDEVLEGQIRARYFAQPTTHRFRDYVRRNLQLLPFVVPLLDVFMNGNIDRPVTAWEDMFLPENLRANLLSMPAIDDEGNPVPGRLLLSDSRVVLANPETFERPFNDYLAMAAVGLAPLALAGAFFLAARLAPLAAQITRRRRGFRALGVALMGWGLLSGLLGTVLLLNWAFSGHPDGWANVNLMIFMPFDWVMIPIGFALLRQGAPVKDRVPFLHGGAALAGLHAFSFFALVALAAAGVVHQDVWRVVSWFGLTTVAVLGTTALVGFRQPQASAAAAPASAAGGRGQRVRSGKHATAER
jgi:hypothetical protein